MAAKTRSFMQCDVFSKIPTGGNALAVVLDGEGLSTAEMQAFARWTNLAETTFICPPRDPLADYELRIFTTTREMLFAGHPTLGSAACWLAAGNSPKQPGTIRQECGVGLVEIDLTGDIPAFIAPPTQVAPMPSEMQAALVAALGLDPLDVVQTCILDNGPVWNVLELVSGQQIRDIDLSKVVAPHGLGIGLIGAQDNHETAFEVRMFSTNGPLKEDPITGSLNAALAHWMQGQGRAEHPYLVAQGTCIGRTGRVHVIPGPDGMRIGGHTNILISGRVTL